MIFYLLFVHSYLSMCGSRGGVGGVRTADITRNEKNSYFSYVCTSTVIHQTESILLKVGPPLEKFSGSAPACIYSFSATLSATTRVWHFYLLVGQREVTHTPGGSNIKTCKQFEKSPENARYFGLPKRRILTLNSSIVKR